jgi:hypothetical protein
MGPETGGQGPLFRELPSPRLLPYTEKPCLAQVWGGWGEGGGSSSENICSSSGGAQEKGKTR